MLLDRLTAGAPLFALVLAIGACSESTQPDPPSGAGSSYFDGKELVLQRVDVPGPGGVPVRVELVGSGMEIDADEAEVSIAVSVRNRSDVPLHAPGVVWIFAIDPPAVEVLDPDHVETPAGNSGARYGFDYSELLGDDDVLTPGETSGAKRWRFRDPGLAPFTFGASARFALDPDGPVIAGRIFVDRNQDGEPQPNEPPYPVGVVTLAGPDGSTSTAVPDAEGARYRFPIEAVGLYRLTYLRPNFPELPLTTPNPLSVLVTPGPGGEPQSIRDADFGVHHPAPSDSLPAVILVDEPGEIEPQDPYSLLAIDVTGHVLRLEVGFSGCQPEHPLAVYASTGWMESIPPQTWAILAHDDLDEPCDAWFTRVLEVDLAPLIRHYLDAGFGEPIEFLLRFRDANGDEHVVSVELP